MKNKTLKNYIFFTSVFFFCIMLLIVGLQKHTNMKFSTDVTMLFNDGWQQVMSDGSVQEVTLPGKLSYDSNHKIVLQHMLPEHIKSGLSICMWAQEQSIQAKVSGEGSAFYQYGEKDPMIFGKNSGKYWNVIRLSESYAGKDLTITLSSPYQAKDAYMDNIYIGEQSSLLFALLSINGVGLALALLMLLAGVVIAVVYAIFRKNMESENFTQTLYLSMFTVMLGVFLFAHSRAAQFFVGNQFAVLLMYYMGVMLLPVPMLFYLSQIESNRMRKSLMLMGYACILNFMVATVLQFANILDFSQTAIATRVVLVVAVVLAFVNAYVERFIYKNGAFKYTFVGMSLMAFFTVTEIIFDVWVKGSTIGNFARLGAVALVVALILEAVNNVVKTVEASRSAAYYERLATVDLMANCYSRTAFNRDIEELGKGSLKDLGIVYFDLNFLKKINDTYGHAKGDQAIKTCSLCIRRVFDRVGKVYRLGGDEFATIIPNCDEYKLLQRLAVFQRLYNSQNNRLDFEFRIASGYAIYDPKKDRNIDALVQRADAAMYHKKMTMKSQQNTNA